MGYELLEKDSLITLEVALSAYRRYLISRGVTDQLFKDVSYELDRIRSELYRGEISG